MFKKLAALLAVVLILGAWAALRVYYGQPKKLTASGMIEITRADITPKTGGYIRDLQFDRGSALKAGQIVFRLDRADLTANLEAAKAAAARARLQWNDLVRGPRAPEIDQAAANVSAMAAIYDQAELDMQRSDKLFSEGAISTQTYEKARTQRDNSAAQLKAAREQLALLHAGNRPDQIAAAKKAYDQAVDQVKAAQAAADDMEVHAPVDGIVLSRNYEQGEYVAPGAAVGTVGNTNDCWLKVYIPSTDLGKIKIGQACQVKIDSTPGRQYPGKISEISQQAEFTPRQTITPSERANLVFYVKIKLDNSQGIFKAGMPADVEFE